MSHERHGLVTLKPFVALAFSALALTACGVGINPQTYDELTGRDFRSQSVGTGAAQVDLRNIGVDAPVTGTAFPVGSDVVVRGSLVNPGTTADALIGASSPVAASTQLILDGFPISSVPIPAASDAGTTWAVQLNAITQPLQPGQYITLTLTFQNAGRTQVLQVPVRAGDNGRSSRQVEQDPYHSE